VPRGREGRTRQTAAGGLGRGALRGWVRGAGKHPSLGPPGLSVSTGEHTARRGGSGFGGRQFRRRPGVVTPSTILPGPPLCPGGPLTEPLYADLQRPLSDWAEPRAHGPHSILEKTQLSANSCAVFPGSFILGCKYRENRSSCF